jgi:Sec-independent protein translocase protein TatA
MPVLAHWRKLFSPPDSKPKLLHTKANALSAFRKAVETGKEYSENAYRKPDTKKETKKTGAKTADTKKATHIEASETATTYQCTIARKGSAKKAAQVLRDLMNKMRESEEYAPLAALIIDSLDEFDGAE